VSAAVVPLALLALGVIVATSRTRTASEVQPSASGDALRRRTPSGYAAGKLAAMRARWSGTLGDRVRAWSSRVLPGVPPTAILGFTAIGLQRESTGQGNPPANRTFHEIGYFQTPAGPSSGPAPAADPRAPYNHWGSLGRGATVRGLLGRDATMSPDAWKDAVPDQVAVGLADLAGERATLERLLRAAGIATPRPGSPLDVALTFMAFSAGASSAARILPKLGLGLVADPNDPRALDELVMLALGEYERGALGPGPARYPNPYHALLRVAQKLSTGYALASALGLPEAEWYPRFARGTNPRDEEALTLLANGRMPPA